MNRGQDRVDDDRTRACKAAGEVMSHLKMMPKVWRLDALWKHTALIVMCRRIFARTVGGVT